MLKTIERNGKYLPTQTCERNKLYLKGKKVSTYEAEEEKKIVL